MSREWLSIGRDIEDFQSQLIFLQATYKTFCDAARWSSVGWKIDLTVDYSESFLALQSQNKICIRWIRTYLDRTNVVSVLMDAILQ